MSLLLPVSLSPFLPSSPAVFLPLLRYVSATETKKCNLPLLGDTLPRAQPSRVRLAPARRRVTCAELAILRPRRPLFSLSLSLPPFSSLSFSTKELAIELHPSDLEVALHRHKRDAATAKTKSATRVTLHRLGEYSPWDSKICFAMRKKNSNDFSSSRACKLEGGKQCT